jgi:hypothetical protein
MMLHQFFGLIECDIAVPPHLRQKFSEMSPIFKNVSVGREHVSAHMREYCEQTDSLKTPQRMLIGSLSGTKIRLLTPLAKWYVNHGLEITHVHQIVQFVPLKCFECFGDSVTEARRAGDVSPDKALLAETSKLVGNSVYGKMITNKENHRNVVFVSDEKKMDKMIGSRNFISCDLLEKDFFEFVMDKKKIIIDIPIVLGFSVLQYAKLRMLEFYYDLIDKYVDRRDFQYCEMDTDSAYLALSDEFHKVIKPELRDEFYTEYGDWFPRAACDLHRSDFVETM